MSDSDCELLTNSIFTYQNESTTVSARGPDINTTNLTGMSFRNNILTSTMNKEWQRQVESNYDQRRIGYQRNASPVSIASACDARQRNFNRSYYGTGMSSQRSVFNGRGGSPTSLRSIDSNTTMTGKEIAMALHTTHLNEYDMKIIKEAIKRKSRKLIEKRRNRRLKVHKGYIQKSGNDDSGDLASNSSISSDDRSTITSNYNNNMSRCMSTKTYVSNLRKTIKESNLLKDCSENRRQNRMHTVVGRPTNLNSSRSSVRSFRSEVGVPSSTESMPPPINFNKTQSESFMTQRDRFKNGFLLPSVGSFRSKVGVPSSTQSMPPSVNFNKTQSQSFMTQRDRFKNGFLLPSKRFHSSVTIPPIPETLEKHHPEINVPKNAKTNQVRPPNNLEDLNSDDDDGEIFSEIITIDKPVINLTKRSIANDDDICLPDQKRRKVASPCKNVTQSLRNSTVIEKAQNDFVFPKPAFPVRKAANMNTTAKKLVSNSGPALLDSIRQPSMLQTIHIDEDKVDAEEPTTSQNTTDLSMRPSFIKRKLYTQKMDVTENKANDILAANSPQNSVYGAIQKEKNKARKLVTSQYCLSRDIQSDENNLLDLIHKIVPAERMSTTKTVAPNSIFVDDDKWDESSFIISTRKNDEDLSDTFTDEDSLYANNGKPQPSPKASKNLARSPKVAGKKVVKSPTKAAQVAVKVLGVINGTTKNVQYGKSFWDTDIESDAEGSFATRKLNENDIAENTTQAEASKPTFRGLSSMPPSNRTLAHTTMSSPVFNNKNKNYKILTHRNTKPNPKKNVSEKHKDEISNIEPLCNKQTSSNLNISVLENNTNLTNINNNEQNKKSKAESNKLPPRKQNKKTNKENDEETAKETKQKAQIKKQNSKQVKILKSVEKSKPKNNIVTDSAQANPQELIKTKPENTMKSDITQNKGQKGNKNLNKTQNKNAGTNKKAQRYKPSDADQNVQNNKNKKLEVMKADNIQQETAENTKKNNQNTKRKKTVVTKLSDSITFENSFTESNNSSIRPVRSCRISKQNNSRNSNEAKVTLNMTLRSRTSNSDSLNNNNNRPETNKPAVKTTRKINSKNEQSLLSDPSFSLPQGKLPLKKPFSNLYNAKELNNSDVSFSITNDKDSPLPRRGQVNSRSKNKKTLSQPVVILKPLRKITVLKHMSPSKHELRPIRNKLANKRYAS